MPQTVTARSLDDKLRAARTASIALATTASGAKDAGLEAIATAVENGADRILPANELDLANGREGGLSAGLQDRLRLSQVRVPFGVVGAIYEARPNVTIDIAALALKSGNAVVLRGGSAAENTNRVLVELLQEALESAGLPGDAVQTIDEFGREGATQLMG